MPGPERKIEAKCEKYAKSRGCMLLKWAMAGRRGVQDRILLIPDTLALDGRATTAFVEFKAPGAKPTELQELWRTRMLRAGFDAYIVDNYEQFVDIMIGYVGLDA